jgi:hypothetical protein
MQKTLNLMVIDHFGSLVTEYRFWLGKILDHKPDTMMRAMWSSDPQPHLFPLLASGMQQK